MTPASDPLAEVAAAYQGLERPESFAGDEALERYRTELLVSSSEQSRFLLHRLPSRFSAVEAACGNGRLLVALATGGDMLRGVGFDIAASRIDFAQRWAADLGLDQLRFEVGDVVAQNPTPAGSDVAVLITGALAYFGPPDPALPGRVVARLRDALLPGGLMVLELYPHPRERRLLEQAGGVLRTWRELPEHDPWRFYLSHMRLHGDVLIHDKTFVHRVSGAVDEGRREQLTLFTADAVRSLLDSAELVEVELHDGWSDVPYGGGDVLVATARRRDD